MLGRIPASKVTSAQLRIFSDFPSTFAGPKIYLYLTDSKKFRCFEKLWIWIVHFCYQSPTEQDYDTPWYLFFGKDFGVNFRWFVFGFDSIVLKNHIPLWGVPYVPTDHQKHRESTSYTPLEGSCEKVRLPAISEFFHQLQMSISPSSDGIFS